MHNKSISHQGVSQQFLVFQLLLKNKLSVVDGNIWLWSVHFSEYTK